MCVYNRWMAQMVEILFAIRPLLRKVKTILSYKITLYYISIYFLFLYTALLSWWVYAT